MYEVILPTVFISKKHYVQCAKQNTWVYKIPLQDLQLRLFYCHQLRREWFIMINKFKDYIQLWNSATAEDNILLWAPADSSDARSCLHLSACFTWVTRCLTFLRCVTDSYCYTIRSSVSCWYLWNKRSITGWLWIQVTVRAFTALR